jgi:hypothetical protein
MKDPTQTATESGRKPAPIFTPTDTSKDARKALVDKLNAENPDFVHSYQSPMVLEGNRDWELQVKQQEIVRDKNGSILHHKGDPVVRQPRKLWEAERLAEAERSRKSVVETGVLEEDVATKYAKRRPA